MKRIAAEQGRILSDVTQEMLRRGLEPPRGPTRRKPVRLPTFSMGPPAMDVADRDALYEALDRP